MSIFDDLTTKKKTVSAPNAFSDLIPGSADYTPSATKQGYDIQQTKTGRDNKIAQYKSETAQAEKESKTANSVLGFAGNFGKGVVSRLANSEVGLGKTIAKTDGKARDNYLKSIESNSKQQADLVKLIRKQNAEGKDTTKLKQIFNELQQETADLNSKLEEATDLPSDLKVAGQIGGTVLDLATAGTYGKAAGTTSLALGNSGRLASSAPSLVTKAATATGSPELGKIAAQKASGLFTKKGIANVGKGAAIGYASDVTQGLQGARGEDREGKKALIPGAGTAIGAAIPFLSETTQSIKNVRDPDIKAQKLIDNRKAELDKLDGLQTLRKTTQKGLDRGIDVKKVLSETDVLHGAVDDTGRIITKGKGGAIDQYTKEFIDGNEAIVSDVLKKEGRSIAPQVVQKKLDEAIMKSGIEGKALTQARKSVADEMAGYALRSGDNGAIPVSTLHDAKVDKYNGINFFTNGTTKKLDKTVAHALKELVEDNTKSTDVKAINKELSKHFAVLDYLEKLDGRKVGGGKLGKYFASSVGAIVGSHFGPLGAIAGAEAGSKIKGNAMSQVFDGKTGKTFPQAQAITDAIDFKNAPPARLPGQVNNLGSLQNSQAATTTPAKIGGISDSVLSKFNYVKNDILSSGSDLDKIVQSGDITPEQLKKIYVGDNMPGAFTPEYGDHVVSDIALKLDKAGKGLGEKFKKEVGNIKYPTARFLRDEAMKILNKYAKK